MGGILKGVGKQPLFDLGSNPVADTRDPPGLFKQALKTVLFYGPFDIVVVLTAYAELTAGLADISECRAKL